MVEGVNCFAIVQGFFFVTTLIFILLTFVFLRVILKPIERISCFAERM